MIMCNGKHGIDDRPPERDVLVKTIQETSE